MQLKKIIMSIALGVMLALALLIAVKPPIQNYTKISGEESSYKEAPFGEDFSTEASSGKEIFNESINQNFKKTSISEEFQFIIMELTVALMVGLIIYILVRMMTK